MKASTVARETRLPIRWVHRAARRKSGSVHHEEDAVCSSEPCMWCDALRWVLSHAEDVRTHESEVERRDRMESIHDRTVASVRWKRENYDLFEFLEGMVAGDFRDSALRAVENGTVSPSMEDAVREAVRRRATNAPALGVWVDVLATVDEASETVDRWGRPVLRIEFVADDGWRGRVETTDASQVRAWRGAKPGTSFAVRGRVVWRVDRMAVVDPVGPLSPVAR